MGRSSFIRTLFLTLVSTLPEPGLPRTYAQSSSRAAPAFEVASVKPGKSSDPNPIGRYTPGRLVEENVTLRVLLRTAYQVQDSQIVNGPDWLHSAKFDIVAKVPGNPKPPEILEMLQTLLADRFRVVVHRESRVLPLYELETEGRNGKYGPNLKRANAAACGAPPDARMPPCGGVRNRVTGRGGALSASAIPMSQLAKALSNILGVWVMDKTALEGTFDLTVEWTGEPDALPPGSGTIPVTSVGHDSADSLKAALKDQLGLRLRAQKGPVEVLVVDRAEKPSEN